MARLQEIPDVDHEFKSLRFSALRNAVQIAPYVNEITIGPDCLNIGDIVSDTPNNTGSKKSNIEVNNKVSSLKNSSPDRYHIQSKTSFPYEKILHQCELERRETAHLMFNGLMNKMVAKRSEMMTKFWNQQELEYEKRSQERRNREVQILQEWAQGDKIAKLEQEKLNEENRMHTERMRILLEKQLESTKLFESLNSQHTQMCSLYEEITNISTSENVLFSKLLQKLEPTFSSILSSMNLVTEKCKSGISSEDVEKAAFLTSKMRDLKTHALEEFENLTNAYEKARKQITEENIKKQQEAISVVETSSTPFPETTVNGKIPDSKSIASPKFTYCSDKSLHQFLELKQFLLNYEASYKELLEDSSLKKFRFDMQKAVNTPVNAISSVSGSHLKDKHDKLLKLLSGDRVRVGDVYVSCSLHPQGNAYCMDLLARKLVRQGEHLVSSSPDAAFPIASVIIALWARFPDLGKLILAHFQRDCPYLIPMMIPQHEGQTDEEFYKARGYRYNDDGSVEKQDKFLKRMSGIFRLCAAIWVTKMPNSLNCPHPQGLAYAWRWMAAFINLNPEADISATLIFDFLTVCGSQFFKHYHGQFVKVLDFLVTDFRERIEKIDEGGPKTRLEVFLQNVIKSGHIAPPPGILPDRIW